MLYCESAFRRITADFDLRKMIHSIKKRDEINKKWCIKKEQKRICVAHCYGLSDNCLLNPALAIIKKSFMYLGQYTAYIQYSAAKTGW